MGLMLKTQRNGMLRDWWYGVYVDTDGKRKVVNLNVKWKGVPPQSGRISDVGDDAFEQSRRMAESKLAVHSDDARHKGRAEHLTERLIESKTGRAVEYIKIADLPTRWRTLGRDASASERYLVGCDAQFRRFIEFMQQRNPAAVYLYEISSEDASAFVAACRAALAPGSAKDCTQICNKALSRFLPVGVANPFTSFVGRRSNGESGVIHRKPFTPEEMRALLDASRDDEFIHPLIVTAAMTGMRRADVCNLQWSAVDLEGGMLSVKTSKTEATVEIPIFPMLRKVLEDLGGSGKGDVFPEAATMLKENPDGLTWRFKKIVAKAFTENEALLLSDIIPADKIATEAVAAIRANISDKTRQQRMMDVITRYAAGQSVRQIEKVTGIARASVSTDLHTIETWIDKKFIRTGKTGPGIKAELARITRVTRGQGERAASVRDWHSLRVSWITFALAAGVPMEVVRRVTGHATVEVVLKHYFKPGREQFRSALTGSMPDVLTGGKTDQLVFADEMAKLVGKVQAGSATDKDKKRLRLLAAKV